MKIAKITGSLGAVIGWGLLLAALATYLLFWRIDNEPGVKGPPEMFAAVIGLTCLGVLLFAGGNGFLLYSRAKRSLALTWLFLALETGAACLLSPMILILLV